MISDMQSMTNMSLAVQSQQAASLIGHTVTGNNLSGQSISGPVTAVDMTSSTGAPNLMVNGTAVPLSSVTAISS